MSGKSNMMVFGLALVIALVAGASVFYYVQGKPATKEVRIEEPYKRSADQPPSAVQDETSHPALKDDNNATSQP